jgi:O-antigen/teichoic acid export membrane protein
MEGQLRKLAKQTVIYGGTSMVSRFLNYLLLPFHTYIFGNPEAYGIVNEFYAYLALLLVVLSYGMETTFFRFSQTEQDKKKVFQTALASLLATSSLFIVLGLLFASPISAGMGYEKHPEYIQWFVIMLGLDAMTFVPYAKLRVENRSYLFAALKISNVLFNVLFNVFFLWLCPKMLENGIFTDIVSHIYNPHIGIGYIFISNLIASVIQFVLLFFTHKTFKPSLDWALLKRMLKYAYPLMILGLAGIVNETIDRIMFKYLAADAQHSAMYYLGVYSACAKIAIVMTLFREAFRFAAEPFFFSLYKQHNDKERYSQVMTYFVIVCGFIFLLVMMYIDAFQYFTGKNYREGMSVVPIMLLAYWILGINFNLSIWYKLTGRTQYGAYISVGGAVLTVLFNWLLIPLIGYIGAAWTHLITYLAMTIVSYSLGQKHYPVPYDLRKIGFYIFVCLGLFLISNFVIPFDALGSNSSIFKFIINTFLLLLYGFIVWKREYKQQKNELRVKD